MYCKALEAKAFRFVNALNAVLTHSAGKGTITYVIPYRI